MVDNTLRTTDQVLAATLWQRFGLEPQVSLSEDLMSAYFIFPESSELLDAEKTKGSSLLLAFFKNQEK